MIPHGVCIKAPKDTHQVQRKPALSPYTILTLHHSGGGGTQENIHVCTVCGMTEKKTWGCNCCNTSQYTKD